MAELLTFGALLRRYRKQTLDPHTQGPLSQIRLAEKVHQSTATISYWENDQRTIDAQDRATLLLLLTTLSEHNGIYSLAEANALLEAGNYRALDQEESVRLQRFYPPPQAMDEPDAPPTDTPTQIHLSLDRLALFFRADTAPDESRLAGLVLNWLEYPFKLFTPEGALHLIGILGLWAAATWSWARMFHWPYADQAAARQALLPSVGLSVAIPLILGLVMRADRQAFLEQTGSARRDILFHRVSGSMTGYAAGYILVFLIGLVLYYLGFFWPPARSITMLLACLPLLLAYTGGRSNPYGMFRAYRNTRGEAAALKLRGDDIVFLWGVLLIMCTIPAGVYFLPETLLHRTGGPTAFLGGLVFMLLWKTRNKDKDLYILMYWILHVILGAGALFLVFLIWQVFAANLESFLVVSAFTAVIITGYLVLRLIVIEKFEEGLRILPMTIMLACGGAWLWLSRYFSYDAMMILLLAYLIIWLIIYRRNLRAWFPLIAALALLVAALALRRFDVSPPWWLYWTYAVVAIGLVLWQLRRGRRKAQKIKS